MDKKKKIIIGSIVGAIVLLLVIVGVVYSSGNSKKVEPVETETTEKVNIDEVTEAVSEAATGNTIEKEVETEEVATEDASTEASSEEVTDSVAEATTEVVEVVTPVATSEATEAVTEVVSGEVNPAVTPVPKNSSLMSKFPVIDYPANGTGRGPGANFRKGHDYENHEVAGGKVLGELNWWELTTWTASNGVVLKVLPADQGFPNGAPIIDGCGLDNVPGSDFLLAVAECLGTGGYWGEGTDMSYQMTVVPVSQIPAASAKRTSIDVNDATLLGYKANYESIMNNDGAINGDLLITSNSVAHRALDGGDIWVISYDSGMGAWKVRINSSSAYQYTWDGIKNILKYVNPDGEALYNLIYEDFYTGRLDVIPNFDEWYPYGSNYIYVPDNTNMGYAMYYIK